MTGEAIGLAAQTMFAELIQQSLDANFDAHGFDERGNFVRKKINGPLYWYYHRRVGGKLKETYVGPVSDPEVNLRIKRFSEIRTDFKRRRDMVRALTAMGLTPPDNITGMIIEALWKAGFFRLRGVLVGTCAFQCYGGILGVKMSGSSLMTQDLDAAQFYDVSHMVNDSIPPILDVLRQVDETFDAIPDTFTPTRAARFRSKKSGYIVEFLTPNRGSDRNTGRLAEMPALGGASAIPLRYLDYLIHNPIRSVSLHGGGIPVTVPAPARYAVHKLIVATVRDAVAKAPKDIIQASEIIDAMLLMKTPDLFEAWTDAWSRGPSWRDNLRKGLLRLDDSIQQRLISDLQSRGWQDKTPAKVTAKAKRPRKTPMKKMLKSKR